MPFQRWGKRLGYCKFCVGNGEFFGWDVRLREYEISQPYSFFATNLIIPHALYNEFHRLSTLNILTNPLSFPVGQVNIGVGQNICDENFFVAICICLNLKSWMDIYRASEASYFYFFCQGH